MTAKNRSSPWRQERPQAILFQVVASNLCQGNYNWGNLGRNVLVQIVPHLATLGVNPLAHGMLSEFQAAPADRHNKRHKMCTCRPSNSTKHAHDNHGNACKFNDTSMILEQARYSRLRIELLCMAWCLSFKLTLSNGQTLLRSLKRQT